jgi:DNA polymerase-3 subunit gamma/tau
LPRAAAVALAAQPQPGEAKPGVRLACFEDIVQVAQAKRDIQLKIALESDVRLVRFEEGSLEFSLAEGASPELAQILMRRLQEWTGARWMVAISRAEGAPTLKEQAAARQRERMTGVAADPLVRSVLERFPGAEIVAVRRPEPTLDDPAVMPSETNDEIAYADQVYTEDDL